MSLLLAVLLCCDDTALAGAAYQEAQEALKESHYDAAIHKLQEAVRLEPKENERLMYRDRQGRQKIEYYPHYLWAQIRTRQARDEKDPQVRTQFLREALTHLELSAHPSAPALADTARKDLAAAEKAAAAPPESETALAALKADVVALADQERYEDARERLLKDKDGWDRFPAERDQMGAAIESRRRTVVARYQRTLDLALEAAASASPLEKPDLIPSLLQPAVLPATVQKSPEARFVWLRDFLAVYARAQPFFQRPDSADAAPRLEAMKGFEDSATRAAQAGEAAGFRLAARLSDLLRDQRFVVLWAVGDESALYAFLKDSRQTLQHRESLMPKAPTFSSRDALLKTEQRLDERRALREDLQSWINRAGGSLADRSTMSDPAALRAIANEESTLEQRPRWPEMPRDLQAGVLFHRALLDLVADVLSGDTAGAPPSETTARLRKARLLNPAVDTAWAERLSPKLRSRLTDTEH
jgi:hypothetical protein